MCISDVRYTSWTSDVHLGCQIDVGYTSRTSVYPTSEMYIRRPRCISDVMFSTLNGHVFHNYCTVKGIG